MKRIKDNESRYFINADPIGFTGGMNWFAYASGNPVSRIDPQGTADGGSTITGSTFGGNSLSTFGNNLGSTGRGQLFVGTLPPSQDIFESGADYFTAARTGSVEGLKSHVGFTAEGAAIIPFYRGAGIGPAGSAEVNFNGDSDVDVGLAGGFGAGAAAGITFRPKPFSESAVQSISITGGVVLGGSVTLDFNDRFELVNSSVTLGLGFGFDASYFAQIHE
jgi:hypothetical protein